MQTPMTRGSQVRSSGQVSCPFVLCARVHAVYVSVRCRRCVCVCACLGCVLVCLDIPLPLWTRFPRPLNPAQECFRCSPLCAAVCLSICVLFCSHSVSASVFVMTVLFNQGLTIFLICLFDASLLSHLYMRLSASVATVVSVVC